MDERSHELPVSGAPLAPPRGRLLYKGLDALMTASLRPRRGVGEYVRCIVGRHSSLSTRLASTVGLVDRLIPGSAGWASRMLFRPARFPCAAERVELLASGSGSTVVLLGNGGGGHGERWVLKAYRRTVGAPADVLGRLARGYRRKYETVASWYDGPHDIVVPARFVVLHGPLLGRPAVACLQPFVEGEKRDLLSDFDDRGLERLFISSQGLREQFLLFARRTLEIRDAHGLCVDLLGRGNLMVVGSGESSALRLIDYGIFDLGAIAGASPPVSARLASAIGRLEALLETRPRNAGDVPRGGE